MKHKKNKSRAPATTPTQQTQSYPAKRSIRHYQRGFVSAVLNRTTEDMGESVSINGDIQADLARTRSRSRHAALNNPYASRYFQLIRNNIVGPDGVALSIQAQNTDGQIDPICAEIERSFWTWAKPENCTVQGRTEFTKVQEIVVESVARDGEILVWMHRGPEFGEWGFQIQLLDADHLDENFNGIATNGNRIVHGVEINAYAKPVAYWIWKINPTDNTSITGNERIRVPASDLLHIFDPERASQMRGYPWIAPALVPLHHLDQFKNSVLTNARVASDQQIFYKQNTGDIEDFVGDDEIDDQGNITFTAEPGKHSILPAGWDIEQLSWDQPATTIGDFQKSILKSVASSLGVSYNSLAVDMESINYSSARFGALEDQSMYRSTQKWFIQVFVRPVYENWLRMQLLLGNFSLPIPMSRFQKFANVQYRPRSWGSVDPVKDMNADLLAIKGCVTSHSAVIEKRGGDAAEVFKQIAADRRMMAELGITPEDITQSMVAMAQAQASNQS